MFTLPIPDPLLPHTPGGAEMDQVVHMSAAGPCGRSLNRLDRVGVCRTVWVFAGLRWCSLAPGVVERAL